MIQKIKQFAFRNLHIDLVIFSIFLSCFPNLESKVFAYDFKYDSGESEIINTDIDDSNNWILSNTEIDSGEIKGTSAWGTGSYMLDSPVSLENGDIFLYWSASLPEGAKTERDKYYIGLNYSDNEPEPYSDENGNILYYVDEDAQLKMAIRPEDKSNAGNSYHQLYIDPDFDPDNNYSPASTKLEVPKFPDTNITNFRLKISKVSETEYEASSFYWNGINWNLMTGKSESTSLLKIKSSDWLNAKDEVEYPVTFEAINLQFRRPGTTITAIALTQAQGDNSTQVPESSNLIALPLILGYGILYKYRQS